MSADLAALLAIAVAAAVRELLTWHDRRLRRTGNKRTRRSDRHRQKL